jgi:hypothetical protein
MPDLFKYQKIESKSEESCILEIIESKRVFSIHMVELTPLIKNNFALPKFHT